VQQWFCGVGVRNGHQNGHLIYYSVRTSVYHATTSGGNISVDFAVAPKADCDLQTGGGNVSATLPANVGINLDAHTDGGSVKTELPVEMAGQLDEGTWKGPINGSGPGLKLETSGGNIEIRKGH
jgi:hypothetical protein